jgi:hypothetical protein
VDSLWPERVQASFEGGPLDGRLLEVPARGGVPPLAVRVLPGTDPPVLVAGNEVAAGCAWMRYLSRVDVGRRLGDPWPFILWEQ